MIKTNFLRILVLCPLLLSLNVQAQAIDTLTLQPDASAGKDVILSSWTGSTNSGASADFNGLAWTVSGVPGSHRSAIDFDLSSLPANITVLSATLSLYQNPTSGNGQHSNLSGSNVSWIQRISSPWDENVATWNNQPATDTTNRVEVPQSTSPGQDYPTIDVTNIISDILKDPSTGFGMMIMLQTEQYYRSMIFASSDNANASLHPKLEVIYQQDCWVNSTFSSSSNSICEGDTLFLSNMSSGAESYSWALDGIPFGTDTNTFVILNVAGTYTITLTVDSSLCYDNYSEFITVNPGPTTPTIAQSGVELAATPGFAYQWYHYDTLIIGATSQYYTVTQSGFYSVEVFDVNGCSTISAPFGVTIPNLGCSVNADYNVSAWEVCVGDTIDFFNMSTGATSFEWQEGGVAFSNNFQITRQFSMPGSYAISLIADSGICADTVTYLIVVNALPLAEISGIGNQLAASNGSTYQWYFDDSLITGENQQFYNVAASGFYTVEVTDATGCSAKSDPYGFTYTGIEQSISSPWVILYPNPSDGKVTIKLELVGQGLHQIRVLNALGQSFLRESVEQGLVRGELTFEIPELSPGIYIVELQGDFGVIRRNLIVQ